MRSTGEPWIFMRSPWGDDWLMGGAGDDTVISGLGGGFDELWGGIGDDVLCSPDASDPMRGDGSASLYPYADSDTLYVSSANFSSTASWHPGSGVDVAFLTCGHGVWHNVDADECPPLASGLLLSTPPSPCLGSIPP
jgi:hypothetical protein